MFDAGLYDHFFQRYSGSPRTDTNGRNGPIIWFRATQYTFCEKNPARYSRHIESHWKIHWLHYGDVIMSVMASQITNLTIVCAAIYSGVDQRKHQSSASLAFVRGSHQQPMNFPRKGPVTRKMVPFNDVIMTYHQCEWRRDGWGI